MKKFFSLLASTIVLLAAALMSPTANAAPTSRQENNISKVMSMIPSSIVVEQTATLENGKSITVYYKKVGDNCEVYSQSDLSGYTVTDLAKLQSTSFRIVSQPQGKLIYHTTVGKARKIVKSLVNRYL